MSRKVVVAVAAALLLSAAPAAAGDPVARPTIADGFAASGVAGSQALVRVTRDLQAPDPFDRRGRATALRASAGPIAGFALVPVRDGAATHFAVRNTPRWTCGRDDCGRGGRVTSSSWSAKIPKGDYVLVLLGAPGARVDVAMPSVGKGAPTPRIPLTRRATPALDEDTTTFSTGLGSEPRASGDYRPAASAPRALYGIVHTTGAAGGDYVDVTLRIGRRGTPGCGPGWTFAGRHSGAEDEGPLAGDLAYLTLATLETTYPGPGDLCASWSGRVDPGLRSSQRGVGVYVPLVLP